MRNIAIYIIDIQKEKKEKERIPLEAREEACSCTASSFSIES
jgi:hypothetical protein